MRLFARQRATTKRLVGVTVLALTMAVGGNAGVAQSAQPSGAELQAWHMKVANVAHPSADGCFTATYPQQAWQDSKCATPPSIPMVPKPVPAPRPFIIGNGNDISAQVPHATDRITETNGTFEAISGVTSIESPIGNVGPALPDVYTLQINTNFMTTTACAGSSNPALCQGWEQFIYANDPGSTSFAFIQYWLLMYNNPCPAGWMTFSFTGSTDIYCYRNSPTGVVVPNQPIGNLGIIRLTGHADAAGDSVTFTTGGTAYTVAGGNYITATDNWTQSEFNIFGYGGNEDGGGMASFNAGASVNVRTRINYGGTDAPICAAVGFTGEVNNLDFGTPAPMPTPPGPAVIFLENTIGGAVTNCDAASVIGDTHQHTFGGTAYDFQAMGDFQEALVGSNFDVQTRKVSGAPTWPLASVNQSVATRMGNTKVAICDADKLFVNGVLTPVQSGGGMVFVAAGGGVTIRRFGNTYTVIDASGNSVTASFMSLYLNVDVGLGSSASVVKGLLGNPDNNPNLLQAKNGTIISAPFNFNDLYRVFGDSWRISPLRTLLAPCSQVASGNPAAPFFAENLKPEIRQQAQSVCMQAKVPQVWLGDCILDVAVIGNEAAKIYVNMPPPLVNGNAKQ